MAHVDDRTLSRHLQDFHKRLSELRKNSLLMDFKIIIDGSEILTHKLVLAANSEYFKGMFSINLKESADNQVDLKGISVATMEAILDYCYTCQINLNDDNVESILMAASMLIIEPIQELCSTYISNRIDPSNCLGIANLSDRCNLPSLFSEAFEFAVERFESVVKEKEFLELDDHLLARFLSSSELNITEADLFQSLIEWTQKDIEQRANHFDKLVEHIRFVQIEPARLIAFGSHELVRNSKPCQIAIDQAKNYHLLKEHPSLRNEILNIEVKPRNNLRSLQRIYSIGGWTELQNAIAKVEVYDPNFNEWKATTPMAERRCGLSCVSFGDSIYAVGGHDGQNYLSSVERFDPVKGRWYDDVPKMKNARTSFGSVILYGCIYAIGGQTTTGATNKVEKLSLESGRTWTECAPLKQKRLGAGVTVLDGLIYVVGGAEINGPVVFDSVERYDPAEDSWTFVAPMKTGRKHFGCTSYDGKIYAIGGRRNCNEVSMAEVYDPSTDSWSELPSMNVKRHGLSVVELAGLIYAIGGQSGDSNLDVVEAYDPNTKEWCMKKPMISDRLGGGVAVHPLRKHHFNPFKLNSLVAPINSENSEGKSRRGSMVSGFSDDGSSQCDQIRMPYLC